MIYTAWVTLATILLCMWILGKVGSARAKFKVPAPQTQGPDDFLRVRAVHANTVEQLVMFLPALWLCAYFLSDRVAAIAGAVWIVGRVLYALGYYQAADKRGAGFMIAVCALFALILGTAWGLVMGKIAF